MAAIDPTKKEEARKLFPEMPDVHFDAFFFFCFNFPKKEIALLLNVSEKRVTTLLRESCLMLQVSEPNALRPVLVLRLHFYTA